MSLATFLDHPTFRDVIAAGPFEGDAGALTDTLKATGLGGFGNGLFWLCDPADLEETFRRWIPNPRNPTIPFGRSAFGNIFYAVVVDDMAPSPGVLDVHHRTMRPMYAEGLEAMLTEVLTTDEAREEELLEPAFKRALELHGPLAADEMYCFTPALALGGSADGPVDKGDWNVHLDILFQMG